MHSNATAIPDRYKRKWRCCTYLCMLCCGWYPFRNVLSQLSLPNGFDLFQAAKLALLEYGNIRVSGSSSELQITAVLDQDVATLVKYFGLTIQAKVFPFGYWKLEGDTAFLVIDEHGTVYVMSADDDDCEVEILATCAHAAMEYFVQDVRIKRKIKRDIKTLGLPTSKWAFKTGDAVLR